MIDFGGRLDRHLGPDVTLAGPAADALREHRLDPAAVSWLQTNFLKTELELGHCLRTPTEGPCECDLVLICSKFLTTSDYAPRLRLGRGVFAPLRPDVSQHDCRHQLLRRSCARREWADRGTSGGERTSGYPGRAGDRRPVIGVDSSPSMLEQARENARAAGVQLDLREGDIRDLAVDQPAALIYCPFRALLHLPTWADRRCTFERVTASLQPGGRFAWNAFAFDHRIAARLDGERQDEPVAHTNRYSVGDNRIDITLDSGAKSSLWWATKNEWLGLIDVAELELEARYGGFAREPLTDDSNEYVFVARAPTRLN